jgi:hypothetical protein
MNSRIEAAFSGRVARGSPGEPQQPQPEPALTNEHEAVSGIANADSGVAADETARRRQLHDDAESVVGTG